MSATVPAGVGPGMQFQVQTSAGFVTLTVPPGVAPGQQIQFQAPATPQAAAPAAAPSGAPAGAPVPVMAQGGTDYSQAVPDARGRALSNPLVNDQVATACIADPPQGATVAEAMPCAPPLAKLTDNYSNAATAVALEEGADHVPKEKEDDPDVGSGRFWTAQELQVLQAQPLPQDSFRPSSAKDEGGVPVATPVGQVITAQAAVAQPVLMSAAGMPVMAANARSMAKTSYDGYKGVKSCDPILQNSIDEIMLFLNTHNSRPKLAVRVWGHHQERRTRQVSYRDSNGNTHYRTETYYVTVTDFDYKINLTNFIFPFGYIQSVRDADKDGKPDPIPEIIDDFIRDTNKLKTLSMKKVIGFNFNALRGMVYGYIRALGWRRGLTISFPQANYKVRVWSKNCLSTMWENSCCWCLCHLTIIPCIAMRMYRDCGGHKETGIKSFFQIQYAPIQVFESIKPALWCPGFSAMRLAGEIFRNVFW